MNYGRSRGGVMGLWAGEGDLPTPDFISQEAARALAAGETFYTWQRGLPELREALARYHTRLYGRAFRCRGILRHRLRHAGDPDRARHDSGAGSEVIIPTPAWPNAAAAAGIAGAQAGRSADAVSAMTAGRSISNQLAAARHAAHARACRRLAVQSDRLDRDAGRSEIPARLARKSRPLDHRRRDLCALLVRRRDTRALLL